MFKDCKCMYIPPFVLENLVRAGIEGARSAIHQSELSREKRSTKVVDMEVFTGVTTARPDSIPAGL